MRLSRSLLFGISIFLLLATASEASSPSCEAEMAAHIPPRAANARSGSQFARYVSSMQPRDRERAIREELLSGNIPSFLRRLKPVTLRLRPGTGTPVVATICVMPDYLAIGSDEDYLRIPADLYTARAIADAFDFSLPTTAMVDAIYRQAKYHLRPQPLPPGPTMRSTAYYVTHNRLVQEELPTDYAGGLVAGDKKDVVLTNRLVGRPTRVAIYGWHRLSGRPIQPLSTVHGIRYADYSHGIRLVSDALILNGKRRSLYEVLKSPVTARVLSREGPIDVSQALVGTAPDLTVSADPTHALF